MNHFFAKKSLGQHFLTNSRIAQLIADAAHIVPGETVFEIGPGTGMLTRELLKKEARVVALEADDRAVAALRETFRKEINTSQLTLIHGDIRHTSLSELGLADHRFKVAANIPYYISGMLFERLLAGAIQPSLLVFLVQKEVAERIARSEKESLLSLSVKVFGESRYIRTVTKGNFSPPPKVDSAILAVADISRDRLEGIDEACFFAFLKAGFAARRKQLLGNLALYSPKDVLQEVFTTLNIDERVRGEDLDIETWLKLSRALANYCPQTKNTA